MNLVDLIEAIQDKERAAGYAFLTPEERVVLDVSELEAEVNNGGFHQFFFNSAGNRVASVKVGLRELGAHRLLHIVEQACSRFPGGSPRADQNERQEQLLALGESQFETLDQEVYAYPDPLGELLEAYWSKRSPNG